MITGPDIIIANNIGGVVTHLYKAICYAKEFINIAPGSKSKILNVKINDLLEKIKSKKILKSKDIIFNIEGGTLFPSLLLYPGWWNRQKTVSSNITNDTLHLGNLQKWLFTGFEEWAPSFDISLDDNESHLMAQLASGDEANSIPLIISPNKAKDIRKLFKSQQKPMNVEVIGRFCLRDELPNTIKTLAPIAADYCILVEDNDIHTVKIDDNHPSTYYTGYLWQCLVSETNLKKANNDGRQPNLDEVFFVWEHTNFGTQETLEYNLHSLEQKKSYIQEKVVGDNDQLVMLHKSSILVPGDSLRPANMFYNLLVKH